MTSIINLPANFYYDVLDDGSFALFYNNEWVTTCNLFEDIVAAAYGVIANEGE